LHNNLTDQINSRINWVNGGWGLLGVT